MIKNLPDSIRLPNYNIDIEFIPNGNTDPNAPREIFGAFKADKYQIQIADINEQFNKYLYTTFVSYAVGISYDINLPSYKAYALGLFLYHLLENNNIVGSFKTLTRKKSFAPFTLSVPSFSIRVESHSNKEEPLGKITISKQLIQIYEGCSPKLKNVILMHELLEWANTIFRTSLKHIEIQGLAEGLTYIINNNKFTT